MVGLNPLMNNVTIIHLPGKADEWQTKYVNEYQNKNRKLQWPHENEIHALFEAKKSSSGSMPFIKSYSKDTNAEINDQNVGVSGKVEMLSEPSNKYVSISDGFDDMIGPYSLLSVHESIIETLTSSHHFTTITIGERNDSDILSKKVMSSSKSFVLNPPKDKYLKELDKTKNLVNKSTMDLLLSSSTQTDVINNDNDVMRKHTGLIKKPQMENKQIQVALDWHVDNYLNDLINCPNLISVAKDERDSERGSTPSSFSSAYTVTEQEMIASDNSTSTDAQSDTTSSTGENESNFDSSHESSKGINHFALDRPNVSYVFISKSRDSDKPGNSNRFINELGEEIILNKSLVTSLRLRKNSTDSQSSEGSSTSSQRPYQRDKEDDEMWVANEATYSCSFSDYTLQWLAPPILPKWEADSELEQQSLQNRLLSVVIEERVGVNVIPKISEAMTTLICPVSDSSSLQRKHFANRQRIIDTSTDGVNEKGKESEKKNLFWNKENENKEVSDTILTSTLNNRPTKRFSFLIRSNSLKDGGINQSKGSEVSAKEKMTSFEEVSASDKAILDRLSQLNLEKSSTIIRPRNQPKPSQPSCGRCGEPVYPQEVVRPTSELFFHISCFKCFHCGLKLNVGNFYRYPVKPYDTHIYCRSHLPAPDARPNYTDHKKESAPKDIIKCDPVGLRYF